MKKLNNKGYMLVEIILASVLAFGVAYFIIDLTIKLKNKNDDLLVETEVTTDKTIITNKLMDIITDERENFDCNKLTLSDNNTILYDNKKIDIVNNYTDVVDRDKWTCSNSSGKIKVIIPLNVAQMSTKDYSVDIDYKYQWGIKKVYIQLDMNGGALASKHGSEIGTSGSLITLNGSTIIHAIDHGQKIGSDGLANYNNANYINIIKTGYVAIRGSEWNTKPDGSGDSFNQKTNYESSKFCDASNGACTVTLYVNWAEATECYLCSEYQSNCLPNVGERWVDGTCYYTSTTGTCPTGWRKVPSSGVTGCPSGIDGGGSSSGGSSGGGSGGGTGNGGR